ncbi:M protein repeat protein [Paragonimus heterotremus]|uniref:M protein repeat protein n=1 Tax=Paragonimus heterotremus TaxID=100268 RepID=A0A8J4T375_9TREM|nr:M protein repeat protein [Paragonimus heterotremus]
MKHRYGSIAANLDRPSNPELILWAQLFHSASSDLGHEGLADGKLLYKIFQQLDGKNQDESALCESVETIKDRLSNWHFLMQNVRNYYLEVLQEVITFRPPNLVLISKSPDCALAHSEMDQVLLLLLCAAVRCERRDYFIRQIMDHLNPDVQAGLMNCIKNFTENSQCVISMEKIQSSTGDWLRVIRDVVNQLEDVYLEEIRDLFEQLNVLQTKLVTLQARVRLTCRSRARSVGKLGLTERSFSTVSLGDSTRGGLGTTSTPKLNFDGEDQSSTNLMPDKKTVARDDTELGFAMECNLSNQLLCHDSGFPDLDIPPDSMDADNPQSFSTLYPETADFFYPDNSDKHHLSIELAETKAKLRRARSEIEDQVDQLNELHDQLNETRRELGQVKEERARLADAAHSARHWQDEVDALREVAERVELLETDNIKLRKRLHELDYYKARCEQLSGDLTMLTKERSKQRGDLDDEDNVTMKRIVLEQELAKARIRLAEIEQLRSADLDELKTLREELGRLRLEQCTLARTSSDGICQPVKDSSVKTDNSVLDLSENDISESQRELSQASGCDRITPNLSTQLAESVASRLDRLEADNRRLTTELSIVHSCASATATKSTEELADARAGLAEFKRANQLLTDKLKRLETLVATQTERIKQLEAERRAAESETRKAREALISLQESTDHQVAELSKENSLLTETMKVLRGTTNGDGGSEDELTCLKKEVSVLGEATQTATTRLVRAELELTQLRSREAQVVSQAHMVDTLQCELDQLKTELTTMRQENEALKEVSQRCSELELALTAAEGESARLRNQLFSEKEVAKSRANLEAEIASTRSSVEFCEQLRDNLKLATEKIAKAEAERDELATRLCDLQQKLSSVRRFRSEYQHRKSTSSDGDVDDDYNAAEEEEADSGNKTGDSAEETLPDQFGSGLTWRKTFALTANHSTRYRDRRRRSRAALESDLLRLEMELERLEGLHNGCKNQLEESKANLLQKEAELHSLKQAIDVSTNSTVKQELDNELARMKLALTSAEQELRKLRRDLREAETNPSSTEAGKSLVARIHQLEIQLSKTATSHQSAAKQNDARIKELEQEQATICQQLSSERQTVLTLREQLVTEKIEHQQKTTVLKRIHTGLEQLGFPTQDLEQLLKHDSAINHTEVIGRLIQDHVSKDLRHKQIELSRMKQRADELQNQTTPHPVGPKTSELSNYGPIGYWNSVVDSDRDTEINYSQLIGQLKNRVVELERQNATLEQSLQHEVNALEESKTRIQQLEQNSSATQGQITSVQSQVADLIATNARLQVENTTLHSQAESMNVQHTRLSSRNTELEAEIGRLRSMLESAHAAEAHLTTDYYHLQRLHEQLTQDYDAMSLSLKETKEGQRRAKTELAEAQSHITRLQAASDEVQNLREALELERGTLKGEAKQSVLLREECSRLRTQLDSLTESRDRERLDKTSALERTREARRQLEDLQDRANQMRLELENRRIADHKLHVEVAGLRSRVQMLTEANSKLERENRSLMLQLQSILGQNQELLTSTLETCTHRISEEGALRERLLSLQRQKQHLEDKLTEQYRTISQPKKTQKRMSLVQKARAVLSKRKDSNSVQTLPRSLQNGAEIREKTNSMRSQTSLSNDSGESLTSLSFASNKQSPFQTRMTPGSVSVFDRDPDDYNTGEFRAFLRCLDNGSTSSVAKSMPKSNGCAQSKGDMTPYPTIPDPSSAGLLSEQTDQKSKRIIAANSPTMAVLRGARHPSGDQPKTTEEPFYTTKLVRSVSSQPGDPRHHFLHALVHSTSQKAAVQSSELAGAGLFKQDESQKQTSPRGSKTIDMNAGCRDNKHFYRPLPATDRCEKQLCEVVTTKSTCDDTSFGSHSRQSSEVSRSSSMRSFNSSPRAVPDKQTNGPSSSLVSAPNRHMMNSMASGLRTNTQSQLNDSGFTEALSSGPDSRKSNSQGNSIGSKISSSTNSRKLSSVQANDSSNYDTQTWVHKTSSDVLHVVQEITGVRELPVTLEVVGKPRVLLQYGDL